MAVALSREAACMRTGGQRCRTAGPAAQSGSDRAIAPGAVAGIVCAAILCAVALAVAVAWAIVRSPHSRSLKKRGALRVLPQGDADTGEYAGSAAGGSMFTQDAAQFPGAPGANARSDTANGAAYAAPGAVRMSPPSRPLFIPTDMYPSAQQFMSAGLPSVEGGSGPSSPAGGASPAAPEGICDALPGGAARLPARDVVVTQAAQSGSLAQMFTVSTRAAWDATAAGTMPAPATLPHGSAKPEDTLEAQLAYLMHMCKGELPHSLQLPAYRCAPSHACTVPRLPAVASVPGVHCATSPCGVSARHAQ
jgi:hypothetical protein